MKLSVIALVAMTMLLSSCGAVSRVNEGGLCKGLRGSIDRHAQALLDEHEETPTSVMLTGVEVISGFDAGCRLPSP